MKTDDYDKLLEILLGKNPEDMLHINACLMQTHGCITATVYALFEERYRKNNSKPFNYPIVELCKDTNLCRGTIVRQLQKLSDLGLIIRERDGMNPLTFYIVPPENLHMFIYEQKEKNNGRF